MLKKVISGGQIGADQAGLRVAKRCGLETGGYINRGFKTIRGPMPSLGEEYGLKEVPSDHYPVRTECNVEQSDGTIRFARNFRSPGEICTLRFCVKYRKPVLDVDLSHVVDHDFYGGVVARWIGENEIRTLNVAGNANVEIEEDVEHVLAVAFEILGIIGRVYEDTGRE